MATIPGVVNAVDLTLDGGFVSLGEDNKPKAIRIAAGAYATPFWIQVQGGVSFKVTALPWQGVLPPP